MALTVKTAEAGTVLCALHLCGDSTSEKPRFRFEEKPMYKQAPVVEWAIAENDKDWERRLLALQR